MPIIPNPMPEFDEGQAAFRAGKPIAANPYPSDDPRAKNWAAGWQRAQRYKLAARM